jgi:hypothetical protein
MLDDIFVELVDKGAKSTCTNWLGVYSYDLSIIYNIDQEGDRLRETSDVLSKISEHLLDVESYIGYLKNKYKKLDFRFNIQTEHSSCKLGFQIKVDESDIEKIRLK